MENESVWQTFDALYRTVNQQAQRMAALEARIELLEGKLAERDQPAAILPFVFPAANEEAPGWPHK